MLLILLFISALAACPKIDHLIETLPGLKITTECMYSGTLPVHDDQGDLFYWLFLKENEFKGPLVIFLNGGPGSSSMIALFEENGPLRVDSEQNINFIDESWVKVANMLFIDQPVGVGLSTGNYFVDDEETLTTDMVTFMHKFYEKYPLFQGQDLYLSGESYCGRYIPHIAKGFVDSKDIPIKGIILGNAIVDLIEQ